MTIFQAFVLSQVILMWIAIAYLAYRMGKDMPRDPVQDHVNLHTSTQVLDEELAASETEVTDVAKNRKTAVRSDQRGPNAVVHRPRQIGPKVNGPKYFGR